MYLAAILTPPHLRDNLTLNLYQAMLKPLDELLQSFYAYFSQTEYELLFNGQRIYLEHVLNDAFDSTNRGIYIEDVVGIETTWIFNTSEDNDPTFISNVGEAIDPVYLWNQSELDNEFDFIVFVPAALTYSLPAFQKVVNRYRLASKRWTIQTY